MGWWSATILGGDSPLDAISDLQSLLKCENLYPFQGIKNPSLVKQKILDYGLHKLLKDYTECWTYNHEIMVQVLGALFMAVGVPIDMEFKNIFIKAAKEDEWMKEEGSKSERAYYIEEYTQTILSYEGEPTFLTEESLFNKLATYS